MIEVVERKRQLTLGLCHLPRYVLDGGGSGNPLNLRPARTGCNRTRGRDNGSSPDFHQHI